METSLFTLKAAARLAPLYTITFWICLWFWRFRRSGRRRFALLTLLPEAPQRPVQAGCGIESAEYARQHRHRDVQNGDIQHHPDNASANCSQRQQDCEGEQLRCALSNALVEQLSDGSIDAHDPAIFADGVIEDHAVDQRAAAHRRRCRHEAAACAKAQQHQHAVAQQAVVHHGNQRDNAAGKTYGLLRAQSDEDQQQHTSSTAAMTNRVTSIPI